MINTITKSYSSYNGEFATHMLPHGRESGIEPKTLLAKQVC